MLENAYILLVGINQYAKATDPKDTPLPLRGCINDVRVFKEYLHNRFDRENLKLNIQELIDERATRSAIIKGFREHLCQATSKDLVIFYYSGHGSRESVSREVLAYLQLPIDREDNLLETLICYDSRTEAGYDLADKELATLVAEISYNRPQIVMILDCCHSGGLARSNISSGGRWFPPNQNHPDRPISSYLFASESNQKNSLAANVNLTKSNWLSGLSDDYILLAACRSDQLAQEHHTDRGIFSYFLTQTLSQINGRLSYRDVFNRTNVLVQACTSKQSPQIITSSSEYLDRPFLGVSNIRQQHYFTVSHRPGDGWVVDGGLIHGIKLNSTIERTRLAVFPLDVEDLCQLSLAIATAETIEVLPQLSRLNIAVEREPLNREQTYRAVVTSSPLAPLGVYLTGNLAAVELVRRAIQTANYGEQPSQYIYESLESAAEFQLNASEDKYTIVSLGSDLVTATAQNSTQAIEYLEHIARWLNIAALSSLPSSRIPSNAVKIQIYHGDRDSEITESEIRLEYQYFNSQWQPPTFRAKVDNHSQHRLYCALLNLTQSYQIKSIPFHGSLIACLEPGESVWAVDGNSIPARIPKDILQKGASEYKDILKLVCSTSIFDPSLLELRPLIGSKNRTVSACAEIEHFSDDWVTIEILITTVRAIDSIQNRGIYSGVQSLETNAKSQAIDIDRPLVEKQRRKGMNIISILIVSSVIFIVAWFIWWQFTKEKRDRNQEIKQLSIHPAAQSVNT
jgi:hypothetical protein